MKKMDADFVNHSIILDAGSEPTYTSGQAFVSYPVVFPAVSFYLCQTDGLTRLADAIREEKGFLPMLPTEKHSADYDMDGWYDFYIGINDYTENKIDNCIEFVVDTPNSEDDGHLYTIELDADEQKLLYNRLDKLSKECFGMNCREMLDDAKEELSA